MIQDFFTTSFTIKRAGWVSDGDGNLYSTESTNTTFYGHKQQATPELAQSLGLSFTKTFTVWCPVDTAVVEGDTIDDGTYVYSVRAVMQNNVGDNTHLELIVELDTV